MRLVVHHIPNPHLLADRCLELVQKALRQITAIILLVSVFWSATTSAQIPRIEPPPLVRFTGALLPLEEKDRSHLPTLTVFIKGKRWIFRIAKVEKLTGSSFDGWRLLRGLFPPEVRFLGPERLISLLQEPEIMGKLLTIEGHLYIGDRMFFVEIVEEATKKPKWPKPERIL